MPVEVVPWSARWPEEFAAVARELAQALTGVPVLAIEHVGSTSVPGLAAKPVLDVAILVVREQVPAAIAALERIGYRHRGDLGIRDRESMRAPDDGPRRHVYVCVDGTLHVRNFLAVRDVLRAHPDLRSRYGAVKTALAADPTMDIPRYVAGKSDVLQEVLALSALTAAEKDELYRLNTDVDAHRATLAADARRWGAGPRPER
jgi:GrpB-like predicted nucleotidyltransferase (UPF0157 family)